jgi:hypothetical protein
MLFLCVPLCILYASRERAERKKTAPQGCFSEEPASGLQGGEYM